MENNNKKTKVFVERELNDEVEGEYDADGFFNTPNGSFWDPDGVYFNRDGYDKHGGYYDDQTQEYVPGNGWDEINNCYNDEYNDDYDDEYGSDHDDLEDDGFGEIDLDKIQDEEKLLYKNMNDIEKINEDPTKIVHHIEVDVDDLKDKIEEKKEEPKKNEKVEPTKKDEPEKPKKKSNLAKLFDEVNKDGFDIYINKSGSIFCSEFPMIKMFYKIPKSSFTRKDVTVKLIDDYMNIPEKRLKWDNSIRYYKIVERHNKEVYLLHYICKSPMLFVSERDVVDKRYDFYINDIYYDFSSSTKNDIVPIEDDIVRITDHCSVCKIFEEKDYFNIISITQVDTKFNVPTAMLSVQLPIKYKEWYDSLVNEINNETEN